jgi:hypothetical protein
MNKDLFRTVSSYDPADPENLKSQPIEQDRSREEWIPFQDLLLSKGFVLQAAFFQLLKNYMERMLHEVKPETTSSILTTFRMLLNTLSQQNMSESPSFALELSQNWLQLLHARDPKIDAFCQMLKGFPKGGDHSLGYYLSNYAGQEWLPFPFMEILKFLHEDARIHPGKGALHKWSAALTEIIDKLES